MDKKPQGLMSIGIEVSINKSVLNYVTEIGDLGGKPSQQDATCMKDAIKVNVDGVKDLSEWEVTYLYENTDATSDFRVLKALEKAGNSVDIVVTMPDGTKFTTTGTVSTYVTGAKVDGLIEAKASVSLKKDWDVTDPPASSQSTGK